MASFLLIHGSWHGAWCWERLLPRLRARGHRAEAVDLPGHGADRTPLHRVTLGDYARRVREAAAGLGERPVVVGHSMAGLAISQAAAEAPEAFAALVYLCAFVPQPGERLLRLARSDGESALASCVQYRATGVRIRSERTAAVFYGGCSADDAAWAAARLRPDPWWPLLQRYTGRHPPDLPRSYLECTQDRAISIGHQRAMAARVPFDRVVTLETDHSPFLSDPEALAGHLHALAAG